MSVTLVLGYGNPLRGDDAVGAVVAGELARRFEGRDGVEVRTVHQLTPDMADLIRSFDRVILIDAFSAATAGRLVCEAVAPDGVVLRTFSHYVTPAQLLAATGALYGVMPEMLLTGLTADSFEIGAVMSEPVRRALPELVDMIAGMVGEEAGVPRG